MDLMLQNRLILSHCRLLTFILYINSILSPLTTAFNHLLALNNEKLSWQEKKNEQNLHTVISVIAIILSRKGLHYEQSGSSGRSLSRFLYPLDPPPAWWGWGNPPGWDASPSHCWTLALNSPVPIYTPG